jgi:hypothetical protein
MRIQAAGVGLRRSIAIAQCESVTSEASKAGVCQFAPAATGGVVEPGLSNVWIVARSAHVIARRQDMLERVVLA